MSQFKISRTSEGVWGREVNPYGEKEPVAMKRCGSWATEHCGYGEKHCDCLIKMKWLAAENRGKQEYPLTEESLVKMIPYPAPLRGFKFDYVSFEIGQLISGEIVVEDGIKKIKIV